MQLERKALYNLIRMNKGPSNLAAVPKWQTTDYKTLPLSALFQELHTLGVELDEQSFLHYAEESSSPEEFIDVLTTEDEELAVEDHIYLIVFELWKRLLPTKPSLSIFCDALDELIYLYDSEQLVSEDKLQASLTQLQAILEEHLDLGEEATFIFESITAYFANDLESFLYDYITKALDEEDPLYASELLEGFYPFVIDKTWFDFLKARLVALTEPKRATSLISCFLDQDDAELNLEILQFLAHWGEEKLFCTLAKNTLPLLETEDAFQDLLHTTAAYLLCLDLDEQESHIQEILHKRAKKSLDAPLDQNDPDLTQYLSLDFLRH